MLNLKLFSLFFCLFIHFLNNLLSNLPFFSIIVEFANVLVFHSDAFISQRRKTISFFVVF